MKAFILQRSVHMSVGKRDHPTEESTCTCHLRPSNPRHACTVRVTWFMASYQPLAKETEPGNSDSIWYVFEDISVTLHGMAISLHNLHVLSPQVCFTCIITVDSNMAHCHYYWTLAPTYAERRSALRGNVTTSLAHDIDASYKMERGTQSVRDREILYRLIVR